MKGGGGERDKSGARRNERGGVMKMKARGEASLLN
jgi:hypothetical protein